jgi:hypothetical protein
MENSESKGLQDHLEGEGRHGEVGKSSPGRSDFTRVKHGNQSCAASNISTTTSLFCASRGVARRVAETASQHAWPHAYVEINVLPVSTGTHHEETRDSLTRSHIDDFGLFSWSEIADHSFGDEQAISHQHLHIWDHSCTCPTSCNESNDLPSSFA